MESVAVFTRIGLIFLLAQMEMNRVETMPTERNFFKDCGTPKYADTSYIMGGERTFLVNSPWVVNLRWRENDRHVRCGGAVIAPNLIVTAAHCTFRGRIPLDDNDIWVYVHSDNASKPNPMETRFLSKHIYRHPYYNIDCKSFDLAIIETETNFPTTVRPICLPCNGYNDRVFQPSTKSQCSVVGWGLTEHETFSDVPLIGWVNLAEKSKCKTDWPKLLDGTMFCTNSAWSDKVKACQGDSGGPLMCRQDSGTDAFYLSGLVSFGSRSCAQKSTVHTNVAALLPFIYDVLVKTGYQKDACPLPKSELYVFAPNSTNLAECTLPSCGEATNFARSERFYPTSPGKLLNTVKSESHSDCVKKCCENKECQSAIYYSTDNECYLYDDKTCNPEFDKSSAYNDDDAVYYSKDCIR